MFRGGGDLVSWETGPWLHLFMRRHVHMSGTGILFTVFFSSHHKCLYFKTRNMGGKTVTG